MPWWPFFNNASNDDALDAALAAARHDDRSSRLWNRDHSPRAADGGWSDEAWRNNAQLMRENDTDGRTIDRDEMVAAGCWWWEAKYD